MNQELMTLDFWQDTVIYEDKTLPTGTLACDALNVSTDTLARMNEQCDKINLLLGQLNAAQDASALFPMVREAALTMLDILSVTPPFPYMDIPKHRERIQTVFTAENAQKYVEFAIKATTNSLPFEEVPMYADAMLLQRYTAVFGHLAYSLGEYQKAMLDFLLLLAPTYHQMQVHLKGAFYHFSWVYTLFLMVGVDSSHLSMMLSVSQYE